MSNKNTELQDLQNLFDEMSDYLTSLINDHSKQEEELRYLHEYLDYKNLEEEFYYFKANAHEEYREDMPFPYLTL